MNLVLKCKAFTKKKKKHLTFLNVTNVYMVLHP